MTTSLSPITADEITEARRLDAAATKAPWATLQVNEDVGKLSVVSPSGDAELGNWLVANTRWDQDAALIALYRNLLPRLLSEREPVADGEVERVLSGLADFMHTDSSFDEAASLLRRLARQCAEQKERTETAAMSLMMQPQEIRLHMGELSAQEMRAVQAFARWQSVQIRALLNQESGK